MQPAEKISVTLPPDMLRTLRDAVEAGEYGSTSEVLRDAIRTWQRQRLEDAERLAVLRERVRASLADPRQSLTEAEADAHLQALFASTGGDGI
jgi:antitoxin ParD1/3/4